METDREEQRRLLNYHGCNEELPIDDLSAMYRCFFAWATVAALVVCAGLVGLFMLVDVVIPTLFR
jgi:hypothetical protein